MGSRFRLRLNLWSWLNLWCRGRYLFRHRRRRLFSLCLAFFKRRFLRSPDPGTTRARSRLRRSGPHQLCACTRQRSSGPCYTAYKRLLAYASANRFLAKDIGCSLCCCH